jgi:hypothetical protein
LQEHALVKLLRDTEVEVGEARRDLKSEAFAGPDPVAPFPSPALSARLKLARRKPRAGA